MRGSSLIACALIGCGGCEPEPTQTAIESALTASTLEDDATSLRDEPLRPLPAAPRVDPKRAAIGGKLFASKRLSADGTVACETCHPLDRAGADGLMHSRGANGVEMVVNTLLRLSSRYFPSAADALPNPSAVEPRDLNALRSLVERFQEAPSRELGQRLEAAITTLDAVRAALPEDSAEREDLTVMLGHARVILDRRERVERTTRALLDAPVQAQLEAARSAYERAARQQLMRVMGLRLLASELVGSGLIALAIGGWRSTRRPRSSAAATPRI